MPKLKDATYSHHLSRIKNHPGPTSYLHEESSLNDIGRGAGCPDWFRRTSALECKAISFGNGKKNQCHQTQLWKRFQGWEWYYFFPFWTSTGDLLNRSGRDFRKANSSTVESRKETEDNRRKRVTVGTRATSRFSHFLSMPKKENNPFYSLLLSVQHSPSRASDFAAIPHLKRLFFHHFSCGDFFVGFISHNELARLKRRSIAAIAELWGRTSNWTQVFNRVLPSFTGFYQVLPGFTEFYWVLLGFNEFYRVLPSVT